MFDQIQKIGLDAGRIEREVIVPNMKEINRKLGQENDSMYLAFCVVNALNQSREPEGYSAPFSSLGLDPDKLLAEVGVAIEATVAGDWEVFGEARGFVFVEAVSQGWSIRLGYGDGIQDGTAARRGTIMHLTPEQALAARKKIEGA